MWIDLPDNADQIDTHFVKRLSPAHGHYGAFFPDRFFRIFTTIQLNVLKGKFESKKVQQMLLSLPKFGASLFSESKMIKTSSLVRRTIYVNSDKMFWFPA